MTVRDWAAFAALTAMCVGCSSEPGAPAPAGGSGGQQATGGSGSGGGGATALGGGGSGGATAGSGGSIAGSGGTTGGSAGSGGMTGGSAGAGGAVGGPVTPTEANGLYTFTYGDVVFEVDAMVAGRIVTFSKGGTNVLDDGVDNYYGSTLWLAPEGAYGLSPAGIDTGAFTPTMEGATLVLTGSAAPSGFSVSKRFTVDSALDRVEIVYTITNESADEPVAAWEVTRLAHSGITFYAAPTAGTDAEWGALNYTYDATGQINWIDHANPPLAAPGKLFQDGSGWIAHAQGTLLFMKTFPDLEPSEFPNPDTEVEVFANPGEAYIELENTSALTTLPAGMSLTYTVQWYLRTIPGTVTVESGSQSLFDFAAALAQ